MPSEDHVTRWEDRPPDAPHLDPFRRHDPPGLPTPASVADQVRWLDELGDWLAACDDPRGGECHQVAATMALRP